MSNLNGLRGQLRLFEERNEPVRPQRVGVIVAVGLLAIAAIVGAAEMHLLPTYSADDVSSIPFGAG